MDKYSKQMLTFKEVWAETAHIIICRKRITPKAHLLKIVINYAYDKRSTLIKVFKLRKPCILRSLNVHSCPHKQTQGDYSNQPKNNNNNLNIPFDYNHPNKSKHDQLLRKVVDRNVLVLFNVHQYKKQWFLDFFFFFTSFDFVLERWEGHN